jgi:hypothetical protein
MRRGTLHTLKITPCDLTMLPTSHHDADMRKDIALIAPLFVIRCSPSGRAEEQ